MAPPAVNSEASPESAMAGRIVAAAEAAKKIHYVELTTYAAFHDEFIRYMTF